MRRDLLWIAPLTVVILVVVNLPWSPPYLRGLMTGVVVVGLLWMISWVVWVMGGLGFRLNGVMAEDVTCEVLRKHPRTLATLPSYKLADTDIDAILVTTAAVYAVEVKWRYRAPKAWQLRNDAERLQDRVRELQRELDGRGVPERWIRGLLVVRGPGSRSMGEDLLDVSRGAQVRVVTGLGLPAWLDRQDRGRVGPDFAEALLDDLRVHNVAREENLDAGPVLRWLARTR